MKPSTALKKAKRLLKEEGWIQDYASSDDGWCAIAALAKVTGATEEKDETKVQQNGEWIPSMLINFEHDLFCRSLDYLAAGFGCEDEYTGIELIELNDIPVLHFDDITYAYNIAIAIAKSRGE